MEVEESTLLCRPGTALGDPRRCVPLVSACAPLIVAVSSCLVFCLLSGSVPLDFGILFMHVDPPRHLLPSFVLRLGHALDVEDVLYSGFKAFAPHAVLPFMLSLVPPIASLCSAARAGVVCVARSCLSGLLGLLLWQLLCVSGCCDWVFVCVAVAAAGSRVGLVVCIGCWSWGALWIHRCIGCMVLGLWNGGRRRVVVFVASPTGFAFGGCRSCCVGVSWWVRWWLWLWLVWGGCGAFGELRPPHFVTSSQRVAVVVAAAGAACWSASSTSLSLRAGEVLLCSLPWLVRCRCRPAWVVVALAVTELVIGCGCCVCVCMWGCCNGGACRWGV